MDKSHGRGWRGDLCRAWMRTHIKKMADFNPVKLTASLDPDPIELRHTLYKIDWSRRPAGSKSGEALLFTRFCQLWKEVCGVGYVEDGETYTIKIRPPRSGFTCDICQKLMAKKRKASTQSEKDSISHQIRQHLQQAREAREAYADIILLAQMNPQIASWAIDAADQAKHHCPKLSFLCRELSKIKKIVQQFIGVLDHRMGYALFRRLPYVPKGANLTLTLIIDMIRRGHLRGKSQVYIQWDGASENVAKTNLRFFIWLLLACEDQGLDLDTITVGR